MSLLTQMVLIEKHGLRVDLDRLGLWCHAPVNVGFDLPRPCLGLRFR